MTNEIDGIYTAYLTGVSGQGMAMFVFFRGKIAGADLLGLQFSGSYRIENGRVLGSVEYILPPGTASITGVAPGGLPLGVVSSFDLPTRIDPNETYRIESPVGPVNMKAIRAVSLGGGNDG